MYGIRKGNAGRIGRCPKLGHLALRIGGQTTILEGDERDRLVELLEGTQIPDDERP